MQARISFPLLLFILAPALAFPCIASQEDTQADQEKPRITLPIDQEKITAVARTLLNQLGDADFEVRQQAEQELQRIAPLVRDLLLQATQDNDAEIAFRAETILGSLPKLNYTIADALGEPVPFAHVKINVVKESNEPAPIVPDGKRDANVQRIERIERETFSDSQGRIGVPEFER